MWARPVISDEGDEQMQTKKRLIVVAAGLACCVVVLSISASIEGSEKTYEIRPEIWTPEYRTDAARAIDAYESLMHRYMDVTENNLISVGADVHTLTKKLDDIDAKLTLISVRIARIETALGIKQPEPAEQPKPKQSRGSTGKESAQPARNSLFGADTSQP